MKKNIPNIYRTCISAILYILLWSTCSFGQTVADSTLKKDSLVSNPTSDTTQKLKAIAEASGLHKIVELEFVKEKTAQGPDSSYFNILKVTNKNGSPIQGVVKITVPYGWTLISDKETPVNIAPGNTEYIPIRVALSRSVLGGVAYLINATLKANRSLTKNKNQTYVSKSCYISIPQKRHWDIFPVQRVIYFDRYSEYSPLKLKLFNKGNGPEVVKLEFVIGSSLTLYGAIGKRYFTSLELRPHSDTILSFPVKYLPSNESDIWGRDFEKMTIRINATVDTIVRHTAVNFKHLESTYSNMLADKITPLTVEMEMQNMLAEADPRMLMAAYGVIFLKNNDDVDYNFRFNNIPFTGYGKTNYATDFLWRRSLLSAGYKSKNWAVKIGDNAGTYGSGFLGSVGRGIGGVYDLNTTSSVGGVFTAAIGAPIYAGNVFCQTILKHSLPLISSLNAVIDDYNKINAYGASVQSSYAFGPHSISVLLAPAIMQHNYNDHTFLDAKGNFIKTNDPGVTRFGIASRLTYGLNMRKVNASVNVLFGTRDYWQFYSGKLNLNGSAQYFINDKYSLVASSGLFYDNPRRYNKGILFPKNEYLFGTHRLELASRMTSQLTLFVGPALDHTSYSALKIDNITGDDIDTHFNTISPELSFRCNYKNKSLGSINPYMLLGYTFITSAIDPTISSYTTPNQAFFSSKIGLNIIQRNWGLNVLYYLGPQNFASQRDYYYYNRYSKSIRIMPYFQKYYFNKTFMFSSYDSYSYEALSNSERFAINGRFQFFLGRDWSLFVDNNLFMASNVNADGQKIYNRTYFLNFGVKKVFDIPQPRVKYYNLKVICFKDINGNQKQDENEQGLSDIVISVDRTIQIDSVTMKTISLPGYFAPSEMVTDNFGRIVYFHIPEGEFNLKIDPLVNLKNLYNVNGQRQKVYISQDTTYYIPFVQSYRVVGKIILNRDEFSSAGVISTANVRVSATDSLGNSYPTLTSPDGSYVLYVPRAGEYKITINNIFGSAFVLQEAEYNVSFDGAKEFDIDFIFSEKKRAVNINGTETTTDSLLGGNKTFIAGKDTLHGVKLVADTTAAIASGNINTKVKSFNSSIPVGTGITYRIQLKSSPYKIPISQYPTVFKGIKNIAMYLENGKYKYTVGDLKTIYEAQSLKNEIKAKGIADAFLVPFYKGNRVKY